VHLSSQGLFRREARRRPLLGHDVLLAADEGAYNYRSAGPCAALATPAAVRRAARSTARVGARAFIRTSSALVDFGA
jgi:hypothetical protein